MKGAPLLKDKNPGRQKISTSSKYAIELKFRMFESRRPTTLRLEALAALPHLKPHNLFIDDIRSGSGIEQCASRAPGLALMFR